MAKPGKAVGNKFFAAVLKRIGAPATASNLRLMRAWQAAEGTQATWNPLATTRPLGGAGAFNSVGVRNYRNFMQGVQATAETLKNGRYDAIVKQLRASAQPRQIATSIQNSPWGTGSGVLRTLGQTPAQTAIGNPSTPRNPRRGRDQKNSGDELMAAMALLTMITSDNFDAIQALPLMDMLSQSDRPITGRQPARSTGPTRPRDVQMSSIVQAARTQIGDPYAFGSPAGRSDWSKNPPSFDCSGIYAWSVYRATNGKVKLPAYTYSLLKSGKKVSRDNLQAGDAVFFNGGGHMGIYMGNGKFLEAPYTGAQVRVSLMSSRDDFFGARRHIDANGRRL